jgi:cellulose synthase (UDP-forming)
VALDTKKTVTRLRALVVLAFLVYAPYYLIWRLGTFNPESPFFSWLIWGAEVFGYLTAVLHIFMVSRLTSPVANLPPKGLSVDVFVPTYNESVNLLRHTLLAATRMEYPHQTWLLDDGNRPEMAALAKELDCRYLARTKNTDAKAGNLNNALAQSHADFVAVFDADHVPHKDFLNKTLGFFQNEKVAFVQTPQDFYNLDSYQHRRHKRLSYIWTEQSLFFRVIQRGKDRWNAAYFCGSCAVLRRSALDSIGGFATGTVTEDLHTSIRLHKKGYQAVYYPESLAFGLAPDSVRAFLLQRLRWGQGAMQVWRKEGILFARGLTLPQRLNYLASVLTYFDGWQKTVFYVAPAVVLLTGVMPINALGREFLLHFIPFYLLCFWAYEEAGRGYGGTVLTEQYNMARFATFARATIGGFGPHLKFSVTQKISLEKDKPRTVIPQLLVLVLSISAIAVGTWLWLSQQYLTPGAFWANIVWASINLGLAGSVVRFTLLRKHRRREYRFPIPLPAFIGKQEGDRVLGLVEDISADGCRFISENPVATKDAVSGEIFLPSGRMPFTASSSRHLEPVLPSGDSRDEMKETGPRTSRRKLEYGLAFRWKSAHDAIQLENFLYGSDLQWRILDLQEGVTTPVAWVVDLFARGKTAKVPKISSAEWLPVIYHQTRKDEQQDKFGVLSRTEWAQKPARLIMFESVPKGSRLELYIFGHMPQDRVQGELVELQKLQTTIAEIYMATIMLQHQGPDEVSRR